jgi:hypothetical protein
MLTAILAIGLSIMTTKDAFARNGHHVARTNVNVNRNVNRNININRNVHINRGYHGHHYDNHRGVSTGAAVAIGVAGLAIGSRIAASQLPPSCSMVMINGMNYQQCGNTWYQPQYAGSQVNYIVVNPHR